MRTTPGWGRQTMIESCHHNDDDDDKALGQLRFGNGDCDALPLVLPPVPGASWKIERFNKDMRLYSPSFISSYILQVTSYNVNI